MNSELVIKPCRSVTSTQPPALSYSAGEDTCTSDPEVTTPGDSSPDQSPKTSGKHHSRTLLGTKRSQNFRNPPTAADSLTLRPSRVHTFRHVLGFRTLNQRIDVGLKIRKMCDNIEYILQHDFSGVRLTVEQINGILPKLERAQATLFQLADRIQQHNELKQEVQYMQLNLEKCVRRSTILIQQHTGTSSPLPELIDDNDWHDHNQFQQLVHSLIDLLSQSDPCPVAGPTVTKELTSALIDRARNMIHQCESQSFFQSWAVSKHDLEALYAIQQDLMFHENRLQESGIQHNIATGVLLTIYTEIRSTEHRLQRYIQRLSNKHASISDHESVLANRNLLRELIANAKSDDRQAKQRAEEKDPASIPPESNDQAREFARSFRKSGYTIVPVWAQSWTKGNPKLLRRRKETPID